MLTDQTPIIVRLYDALEMFFPDGDFMPAPNTTVAAPPCFQCETTSHLPPAKTAWIAANNAEFLASICYSCAFGTDTEIKARIVAKVRGEQPPAKPMAAE